MRPFVEKLITIAKQNTLHARRLVISRLGPAADAEVKPQKDDDGDADHRTVVQKLFDIASRFAARPGGYTRILKPPRSSVGRRQRDRFPEFLKAGEIRLLPRPRIPAPGTGPDDRAAGAPETPAPEASSHPASEDQPPSAEANPPAPPPEGPPLRDDVGIRKPIRAVGFFV